MRVLVLSLLLAIAAACVAEVKLASLFTSHMVLQQRTEAPIWGWAKPGEAITIRTTWGANANATADETGAWKAKVKTGAAGGPYEMTVTGENSIWLRNVMLGEVWVCSGQSNMDWPLGIFPGMTPVRNSAEEVAAANYPNIRLFHVAQKMSQTVETTCGGNWQVCTPESVASFSATAYFFGRELNRALKVPVGLIMTTWGGTEVELWTSEPAMKRIPEIAEVFDRYATANAAAQLAMAERKKQLQNRPTNGWEREDAQDGDWQRLAEPAPWEQTGMAETDGIVWYRAKLLLTAAQAKGPATLHLGPIDDEDETWVNGVSVGKNTVWNVPRDYAISPGTLKEGFNTVAIKTVDTGGVGGFRDAKQIALTVGDARIPLTNWRMKLDLDFKSIPVPAETGKPACLLYNGMIAPLIPFAIKGAIWYQGESNVSRAFQYRTTFPNMIKNWREDWGRGDFPFYFVQIAPFNYNANDASAELREAQDLTARTLVNTGMAVTMDVVPNLGDIHPPFKQEVGDRLARLALRRDYGQSAVECYGPTYRAVKFAGKEARIALDHAAGLTIKGDKLNGIEIAGEDKKFVPASARVDGTTLVVWADGVEKPVAVRFGFRDAVLTNLFNGAGLPAPPFRTDDWPGVTIGVKW